MDMENTGAQRKKEEKRYAFEWFMREQDKMHLKMAERYTDEKIKEIAVLVATNTAITLLLTLAIIWFLCKY